MRPLELRLRNFRSYFGADSVFDFRERGLVGVVGPIGSGKSSLLDAISFALFGRTPTVAAATKSLIHQRADGATVSLRFAVDDQVWEVTRALRRKGQSVHGLERLAADEPDAARIEAIVLESEVNERIVELLGLEFDGFSRSVMLAQGRFAEFLRSRPAERDKVLKGVFGHDRIDVMRAAAKERAVVEAAKAEAFEVRLEAADSLAARIEESAAKLAADEARLELLRKAEAKFADHADQIEAAGRVVAHADSRLEELAGLAQRMPSQSVVAEMVEISRSANETRRRLGKRLEEAQSRLASADAALAELDPPQLRATLETATRIETTVQQLEAQIGAATTRIAAQHKRAASAEEELVALQSAVLAKAALVDTAQAAYQGAEASHQMAVERLHDAEHADMAGALRAGLTVGEPCPVCEQAVAVVPPPAETATTAAQEAVGAAVRELAARQQAVTAATEELAAERAALSGLQAEAKANAEELARTRDQLAALESELAAARAELAERCGGNSPAELRRKLEAAEKLVGDSRRQAELARTEHDEAIRSAQGADKEISALRLALAEHAIRLSIELEPAEDVAEVAAAVGRIRAALADETDTLTTARTAAEHQRSELAAAERELRRELAIEGDFATHLAQVAAAVEVRGQQIEADRKSLAESAELHAARETARLHQQTYEALAAELTDSRFVRYLLDEEKRELANLGSEHFERLSSGRYRFSTDGEFRVVDLTSADAVRRADSLSGGETFLASLALALALAEMVARTGGRLDAFFLDEGFGSLDPEHLDLAMEGIEQLAAGAADRLVIVVSHVADMRHRLEDLIELDRDAVTGDTVVLHA